jgi:chromosome segregation ATPase
VLEYTDKANFAQTESIEKIGIIAKMVDNNKGVFGLDFSKTDEAFKEFYNIRSQFGLTNLQNELNQKKQESYQLKSLYKADSVKLALAKGEKKDLDAKLVALSKDRDLTNAQKHEQERVLKEEIKSQESTMASLSESIGSSKSKLAILESEKLDLELKFKEAQKKLEDLTAENVMNIQKIRDQNVEIDKIKNDASRQLDELTKLKISMQACETENNSFKSEIEKLKTPE